MQVPSGGAVGTSFSNGIGCFPGSLQLGPMMVEMDVISWMSKFVAEGCCRDVESGGLRGYSRLADGPSCSIGTPRARAELHVFLSSLDYGVP